MVVRVVEQCRGARHVGAVVVATDDPRIAATVTAAGYAAEMTRDDHASGTDRVVEIAARHPGFDWFINVQGDEPLIPPELVVNLATTLIAAGDPGMVVTAATPIRRREEFLSPHVVKVVTDRHGRALYFSRAPIPCVRDAGPGETPRDARQHIGIYGYHRAFLLALHRQSPGRLEALEKLEQLRWLENGTAIRVIDTDYRGIGVDTPADLERIERLLRNRKLEDG